MITKKYPELIEVSLPTSIPKDIIPFQDKLKMDLNQPIISSIISKKEKDFIIKMNKSFFYELGKLYTKNILLKAKLNELLKEKKNLNQTIIKQEQQLKMKNKKNKNNEKNNDIENINLNKKKTIIQYYRKIKRIRRKNNEIIKIFNCNFPNCNKSYPTKGSLNMHIRLKH